MKYVFPSILIGSDLDIVSIKNKTKQTAEINSEKLRLMGKSIILKKIIFSDLLEFVNTSFVQCLGGK